MQWEWSGKVSSPRSQHEIGQRFAMSIAPVTVISREKIEAQVEASALCTLIKRHAVRIELIRQSP